MVLTATSDDDDGSRGSRRLHRRAAAPPTRRLYNLYLDPKEQHNYMTRKLAYVEAFQLGIRWHLATFKRFPPKHVMGLGAADSRA